MATFKPVNPIPFLSELTGSLVVVKLKWGMEYKGTLKSVDQHMNMQLTNAEEVIDDKSVCKVPQILIRCNNVLYIRGAEGEASNDDMSVQE